MDSKVQAPCIHSEALKNGESTEGLAIRENSRELPDRGTQGLPDCDKQGLPESNMQELPDCDTQEHPDCHARGLTDRDSPGLSDHFTQGLLDQPDTSTNKQEQMEDTSIDPRNEQVQMDTKHDQTQEENVQFSKESQIYKSSDPLLGASPDQDHPRLAASNDVLAPEILSPTNYIKVRSSPIFYGFIWFYSTEVALQYYSTRIIMLYDDYSDYMQFLLKAT